MKFLCDQQQFVVDCKALSITVLDTKTLKQYCNKNPITAYQNALINEWVHMHTTNQLGMHLKVPVGCPHVEWRYNNSSITIEMIPTRSLESTVNDLLARIQELEKSTARNNALMSMMIERAKTKRAREQEQEEEQKKKKACIEQEAAAAAAAAAEPTTQLQEDIHHQKVGRPGLRRSSRIQS